MGSDRQIVVVVGAQWGDEGKGKLVDILASHSFCCARYNGGANAGHTLIADGQKIAFHLLPCGALHPQVSNFIGNGVVLHLQALAEEIDSLHKSVGRNVESKLRISSRCHLTFKFHILADASYENCKHGTPMAIGTTRRGIGPSYAAKALRISLRACDLVLPFDEFKHKYMEEYNFFVKAWNLRNFDPEKELAELRDTLIPRFALKVVDAVTYMDSIFMMPLPSESEKSLLERNWHLVVEGANATMLDLNVGSYPYCTSSDCLVSGIGGGLSLPPCQITSIIAVAKAYCTRVGEGVFPTELSGHLCEFLQEKGQEYGASTGRVRRCGWFDCPMLRYTHAVNNFDELMITKLDVLSGLEEIKIAIAYIKKDGTRLQNRYFPANLKELESYDCVYETFPGWKENISGCKTFAELPENAKHYVKALEHHVGVPIKFLGVGPGRNDIISLEKV